MDSWEFQPICFPPSLVLSDDCWHLILQLCDEDSLLALRMTCRYLYIAASADDLWFGSCFQLGISDFEHCEPMVRAYTRTVMFRLGEDRLLGRNGVPQETASALRLLRRCAAAGNDRAAEIVGMALLTDCYVPPNVGEALRWLSMSQSSLARAVLLEYEYRELHCRPPHRTLWRYSDEGREHAALLETEPLDSDDYLQLGYRYSFDFYDRPRRTQLQQTALQLPYAPLMVAVADSLDADEANVYYDRARQHGYRLATRKATRAELQAEIDARLARYAREYARIDSRDYDASMRFNHQMLMMKMFHSVETVEMWARSLLEEAERNREERERQQRQQKLLRQQLILALQQVSREALSAKEWIPKQRMLFETQQPVDREQHQEVAEFVWERRYGHYAQLMLERRQRKPLVADRH